MTIYYEGHVDDGDHPEDLNHRAYSHCDGCGLHSHGTMLYAQGATGRICAVLFLCKECAPQYYEMYSDLPARNQNDD